MVNPSYVIQEGRLPGIFEGFYQIADHTIRIRSIYESVHLQCQKYQIKEQKADFTISIDQADIDAERRKAEMLAQRTGGPKPRFSDAYFETLAIYRKLADKLIMDDILLFHGSCISVDGEGYLFAAKSGTGKSTHTRLWRAAFGSRAVMVNDDKPLLKIQEGCITAFGTPWSGKHHLDNNLSVQLKAICILERAEQNEIRRITSKEAYPILFQQTNKPRDAQLMQKTLQLLDVLKESVSLYRLGCNQELNAAHISFEGMQNQEKSGIGII